MRILHVIPSMAADVGGPPAVCAGLTSALAARRHDIAIATLKTPGESTPISAAVNLHTFAPDDPAAASGYASSAALAAWLDENAKNFDLLHLHSLWQFPTFAAARACWSAKTPYVVLLNGMLDHYSVAQRSRWKKRLYWLARERRIHARAAALHCLNAAEIRRAVRWIKSFPKFIVGNAIASSELAQLPPPGLFRAAHPEIATAPIALFLSRLHPKKGLDRLIPAWKHFAARVPAGKLVIAGTGEPEYVAALDRLIAGSQLSEKIIRVGQLTGSAKWQALVDADIFVLPSHQEGFSMAITEALAAGAVPVVTEECNFDELAKKNCGIIIPGGSMPALVEAAAKLIGDLPQRKILAENGRQYVRQNCTWETVAAQMESIYTRIQSGEKFPVRPIP